MSKQGKNIYLDHAATTPVDAAVLKVMQPFWSEEFGNPSSLYKQGVIARKAVELSRKKIAEIIGARPPEIIFTAGGTESCNLAIFGVARNHKPVKKNRPHIIISAIEHHAVLNPVKELEGEGYDVSVVPVDEFGAVSIPAIQKAVRPQTILVSIIYANNEIGTIQPIAEIGKSIKKINSQRFGRGLPQIYFHTDACQAAGFLDLDVLSLGVDLMTVNGSKIYGPKQSGFLFVRNGINLKPLIYGGGQEKGLRSGTENVAAIVGLAKALEMAESKKALHSKNVFNLQKYFISKLLKIKGVELNGPKPGDQRLVNNINITVKGVEGEALMLYLDSYGIAVSTGSACATGLAEASHVLLALGQNESQARSAIRLTLGKATTKAEVDSVLKVINDLIIKLREVNNFLL